MLLYCQGSFSSITDNASQMQSIGSVCSLNMHNSVVTQRNRDMGTQWVPILKYWRVPNAQSIGSLTAFHQVHPLVPHLIIIHETYKIPRRTVRKKILHRIHNPRQPRLKLSQLAKVGRSKSVSIAASSGRLSGPVFNMSSNAGADK